jgi:hypothetical protein
MSGNVLITTAFVVLFSCVAPLRAAKIDTPAVAAEIDALLEKDWAANKLQRNAPANDSVFVRRVYLDIVGRIPSAREAEDFLNATDLGKRPRLISTLLAGDGYALAAFNYWADVLRLQQFGRIGPTAGAAYVQYLKDSLRTNKPYDQFVRELITAKGKPWENGAIGYYMRDNKMPLDNFANTARTFLGTRIECAQCHNHPFDKWKQKQFYEMTAFTYGNDVKAYENPAIMQSRELLKAERKDLTAKMKEDEKSGPVPGKKPKSEYRLIVDNFGFIGQAVADIQYLSMGGVGVINDNSKRLTLPHDYQYDDAKPLGEVMPVTMMGHAAQPRAGESSTEAYARWMTSPENPRFTTVIANRLWKMAFGLALIEPLDEMLESTVPSNPELMRRLEDLVKASGYDLKACLNVIFNTRAYQSASTKEEVTPGTVYHFTGPVLRRMSAEQIYDSILTLITPSVDEFSKVTHRELQGRIVKSGKLIDALDLITPKEALQGAKVAAEAYRASADMAIRLREEIEKAKANNDLKLVDELTKKVLAVGGSGRRALGKSVFLPAVERLEDKMEGRPPRPSPFSDEPAHFTDEQLIAMNASYGFSADADALKVKGYDRSPLTPKEEAAVQAREDVGYLAEAKYFNLPESKHTGYVKIRRNQLNYWRRAADSLSPAYRGSYLRIFGQSDRELIENGSRDATIPQALTMMNSDLLKAVLSADSHLKLTINREDTPERQLAAAYLALLARPPTDKERAAWKHAQERGLDSMDDLIYALINTRRFIFNP